MDSIFGNSLGTPVSSKQATHSNSQSASGMGPLSSFRSDLSGPGISGGRSPIQSVSARGDPVLAYEWEGVIIDPGNPEPIPSVYIESIQAPSIQFGVDHRYFHGRNLSYPSTVVSDNLTMTLYNDLTGSAAALAASWLEETSMTESGGYKLPSEFKKSIKITVYDAKHLQIYSMMIGGCFPIAVNHSSAFDYKSNEPNSIVLTLSVDSVYLGA